MDVRDFHRRACIADAHADALMWNRDLTRFSDNGHVDFPRLQQAGVKLQCFTVVTRGFPVINGFRLFARWRGWPAEAARGEWARACWQIAQLQDACDRYQGAKITRSANELRENLRAGILSAVIGIEGAHALEGSVERVAELWNRGVRFMSLTHLSNNSLGGSSFFLSPKKGLTDLGRVILEGMTERGMAVDLAHASSPMREEIFRHPGAIPFCSHTGVTGVTPLWRNLTDQDLRRIADRGGVIGIIFATSFIGGRSVEHIVNHIEHALKIAGEDAVGLGSDFDGMVPLPKGMRDVRDLGLITSALVERRHPIGRVEKVMGENWRRFFERVLPSRG